MFCKMLSFQKYGSGTKILLAFHGMGQDSSCFQKLAKSLDNQYTIYAFDLFFHGKNIEQEAYLITKSLWQLQLQSFLSQHHIQQFSVMGFSMGGRFALATLEAFPQQIEEAFLIAPDGISENPFYVLATRFAFTRPIFKLIAFQQNKVQYLGNLLVKLKLLHPATMRFAQNMLDTPEKQKQIYQSWLGFRGLRFSMKKIASLIEKHGITTKIFVGKYDKILPEKQVYLLTKRSSTIRLIALNTGHTGLVDKVGEFLSSDIPINSIIQQIQPS
jgi:pimeloyl-ACP methyl ester carboxylesterase